MTHPSVLTEDPQLDALLRQVAAISVAPRRAPVAPLEPGATLGPYRVLEQVGAGGMGVVYRAHDSRLDREVALKVLPRAGDGDAAHGEARSAAALSHPNLASVYDVGELGDVAWYAMELVRGSSLRAFCELRTGGFTDRLGLAMGVTRALAALHHAGWIHCDVKPENVMVTADGTAKLLDFGLARPTNAPSTEHFAGTPRYMAPEQLRGEPVDASADLYAMGKVLEELLGGEGPGDLDRLIRRCLSADRSLRPGATELLLELERLRTPRRRWRVAGALLVLAVGATALLWPRPPPEQRPSRRLTGQGATHPISEAALSLDGQTFALVDEEGLSIGPVDAPERATRVPLEQTALYVQTAASGFHVATQGDGGIAFWHVVAGRAPVFRYQGVVKHASLSPDGEHVVAIEGDSVVVRRTRDGLERARRTPEVSGRLNGVDWSLVHRDVYALSSAELTNGELVRTLELWSVGAATPAFRLQSHRLTQGYRPVAFGWSARGPLLYALSDEPGEGNGSSVWQVEPGGSPSHRATIEAQFVATLGEATDGTLLTVRERTHRRVFLADVNDAGALSSPRALTESELDERPTGWESSTQVVLMAQRDFVPHLARRDLGASKTQWLEGSGWAQTWPTPAPGGLLYWWTTRPTGDAPSRWTLVLREPAGSERELRLPSPAVGRLGTFSAPPLTHRVRCAGDRCVLAVAGNRALGFFALALDGGPPVELRRVEGAVSTSVWALAEDGRLVVGDGARLRLFSRDEETTVEVPLLHELRGVAFDRSGRGFYVTGMLPSGDQLVGWLIDGRLEVLRQGPGAYADLYLSPDGSHLAFLEREFAPDVWVTPR